MSEQDSFLRVFWAFISRQQWERVPFTVAMQRGEHRWKDDASSQRLLWAWTGGVVPALADAQLLPGHLLPGTSAHLTLQLPGWEWGEMAPPSISRP